MNEVDQIIERLLVLYGNPNTPDPKRYLEEMRGGLAGYDIAKLHKAVDEGRRRWKFFPRVFEVVEIFDEQNPPPPATPEQARYWKQPVRDEEEIARSRAILADCLKVLAAAGKITGEPLMKPKFPNRDQFRAMQETAPDLHIDTHAQRGKMAAAGKD